MTKNLYFIKLKDLALLDDTIDLVRAFKDATPDYDELQIRLYATEERLSEFLRALKAIGIENVEVI